VTRVISLWILATALSGCNAILGIEEAKLDPDASVSPAGAGGAAGGGAGGAGGGTCAALTAPDACNKCIAARCCDQFAACSNDAACKTALGDYNDCVGMAFTNDAGGTCDETFGSTNQTSSNLAICAFQTTAPAGCLDVCMGQPVGADICMRYCNCIATTCPEKNFGGAECADVCAGFNERQLTCRPYHCGLAKISKDMLNDMARQTHCGHAVGESLCP
jgi:hypothetical protein